MKYIYFLILFIGCSAMGNTLPHQGRIMISGSAFEGTGYFKFGLTSSTSAIVWNHEGGQGPPSSTLPLEVKNGFYSCEIGDSSINGMSPFPANLFEQYPGMKLRIWFDDGQNGLEQLASDQPLLVAPYSLTQSTSIAPQTGSITRDMLAPQLSSQIDQSSVLKATNIPNSEVPLAGSIKFDGNDFLGYDGSQWKSLTVGNTQPATIVSGENAQRRAGEIRWDGENFEGYNGRNWIPFTMSLSMTGGMFEFNASTIGYDLSITDSFTFEGIDFNTSKVLIPDLVTNQVYEVKLAHEKGVAVPSVTLNLGYNYGNMLAETSVRTAKFGDLNGFYMISEALSHMEMKISSMVKMLTYSCSAVAYADVGNGQFITIVVFAPDSWNLDMSLSNIPIDDDRTLLDILPPKTDRDEAKEKLRTLIESISIKKI
jgi:hypothetical protein